MMAMLIVTETGTPTKSLVGQAFATLGVALLGRVNKLGATVPKPNQTFSYRALYQVVSSTEGNAVTTPQVIGDDTSLLTQTVLL
mmetsp:Transcript_56430/g.122723  ORF Transcript_56430/g.122723 Transcript_56430/m.122723 type:complete len:84 (+) Transcript_56430:871-1122(+)